MATAQILLVVKSPTDVSPDVFQAVVGAAVRAAGGAPSQWTYDATPVILERDGASAFVQLVRGGPWNGLEFTSGAALPLGQSSAVLSAFRQNVVGLPADPASQDAAMRAISSQVLAALAPRGEIKSATRTIRNTISWDRGVPGALSIGSSGGSAGSLAVGAGFLGLLALGAIYLRR